MEYSCSCLLISKNGSRLQLYFLVASTTPPGHLLSKKDVSILVCNINKANENEPNEIMYYERAHKRYYNLAYMKIILSRYLGTSQLVEWNFTQVSFPVTKMHEQTLLWVNHNHSVLMNRINAMFPDISSTLSDAEFWARLISGA